MYVFLYIYVLFTILTVCNIMHLISVRVFVFVGLVQNTISCFYIHFFPKPKVPELCIWSQNLGKQCLRTLFWGNFLLRIIFVLMLISANMYNASIMHHNSVSKHLEGLISWHFSFFHYLYKKIKGPYPWIRCPKPCINIWTFRNRQCTSY